MPVGSPAPWSYVLIRFLFKFVLKVFYGTIVVENAEFIPPTGSPCIVCANHSNSLTDALLLVASIPSKQRNMLRLTAKATQFGHNTFTSWLIESAGTVPIKRRKDYVEGEIDNSDAMLKLMEALETGDAVCMFPEGMSRYHPTIAPLKTGVARLVSDVLSRNKDQPDFEISVLTCSITYMHRQHWRSDVLVTFHKPIIFTPTTHPQLLSPVNFNDIRTITNEIEERIISGTFSAPSWDLIRISKLASRMYAPLGTQMTLGDHVRITRAFLQAFKAADQVDEYKQDTVTTDLRQLRDDLRLYQDELAHCGIKDDRIRRPLRRRVIATRFFVRLFWGSALLTLSLPGLLFWFPIFITTFYAVHNFKKTGPIFDTWDEIAQYKLIYGLFSGLCVWLGTVMLTWPIAFISLPGVPALMWMSLRWMEDAVAALRACAALARLMAVGRLPLQRMGEQRRNLYSQVLDIGVNVLNLPEEPEKYFLVAGGAEKGRARGRWQSGAKYFSLRRRRKRDWNETLRLYDKVDYPQEE